MLQFKLTILTVLILFITSSVFISCSNEDNFNNEVRSLKISNFNKNFPNLVSKISYKDIQEIDENEASKAGVTTEGITFPVIDNNIVIGRYFGTNDENVAVYTDYSNYQNEIIIHNVNNPTEFEVIKMIFDATTNTYVPQISETGKAGGWCIAKCTIVTIAIAAGDGPSPILDYLAVAYQLSCLADCAK